MSFQKIFTAFLFALICIHCPAQLPLSGFIPGAVNAPYTDRYDALVWGGKIRGEYTYRWEIPQFPQMGEETNSYLFLNAYRQMLPDTFEIFCIVKDIHSADSIVLQKRVFLQKFAGFYEGMPGSNVTTRYFIKGADNLLSFFTENRTEDISSLNIEVEGLPSSYFRVPESRPADNHYYLYFNAPVTGKFKVKYLLKDQAGNLLDTYSQIIEVRDESDNGYVQFYDSFFPGELPDIQVTGDLPFDKVVYDFWVTDPSAVSRHFVKEVTTRVAEIDILYDLYRTEIPGTYEIFGDITLDDNRVIRFSKTYTVYPESTLLALGTAYGCKGDTITLPFFYKKVISDTRFTSIGGSIYFAPEKLQATGIRYGKKTDGGAFSQGSPSGSSEGWSMGVGFFSDFPENGDTILLLDFVIKETGNHFVWFAENNSTAGWFDCETGGVNPAADAGFSFTSVEGIAHAFSFTPVVSDERFTYQWTFGSKTDNSMQPVFRADSGKLKNEVCLTISRQPDCSAKFCDSVYSVQTNLFSISGILKGTNGESVAGNIFAYRESGGLFIPSAKAVAGPDGRFRIDSVEASAYLLLGIPDDHFYNAAFYFGEGLRSRANRINVTGNVTEVDFVLERKKVTDGISVEGKFNTDSVSGNYIRLFQSVYGYIPSVVFLTGDAGQIIDWTILGSDNSYRFSFPSGENQVTASMGRVTDELVRVHSASGRIDEVITRQRIYPVPFREKVIIEMEEEGYAELSALNGQSVLKFYLVTGINNIDAETLPAGVYLLRLNKNSGDEIFQVVKF
jgi:hypothetical protein